jgi:GntR family transcriptional regulator
MRGTQGSLYRDAANRLRRELAGGRYGAGDRIPTELELCNAWGVSRTTVRKAVEDLVADGVLRREQGRGTFVTAVPAADPVSLQHPARIEFRFRLLNSGWTQPTFEQAAAFGLGPMEPIYAMSRLRLDGDAPIAVTRYLSPSETLRAEPPTEDERKSVTFDRILLVRGVRLFRTNILAEPAILTQEEADLLEVEAGASSMRTERISFNEAGRAIRLSQTVLRPDRARLFWSVRTPYGARGDGESMDYAVWSGGPS